jgi:hypothetical protein
MIFLTHFYLLFLENYQYLYKALLGQSLPIAEFYHWLKYLLKFQSHPVHRNLTLRYFLKQQLSATYIFNFRKLVVVTAIRCTGYIAV